MKTLSDLSKDIDKMRDGILRSLERELTEIGEEACNHARMAAGYNDITGTTRSAFKYRVSENGRTEADGGFEEVQGIKPKTLDPEQLADEALESEPPADGLSLTLVNGSPYAKYIEDKGMNVTHLTFVKMRDDVMKLLSGR